MGPGRLVRVSSLGSILRGVCVSVYIYLCMYVRTHIDMCVYIYKAHKGVVTHERKEQAQKHYVRTSCA